jgi:HAD superfamily hydrolase (TIGR01549 family)
MHYFAMKTIIMDFNDTIDNTAQAELRALIRVIKEFKLKIKASELLINLYFNYLYSSEDYDKVVKKTLLESGVKKELIKSALKIFGKEADEIRIKEGFFKIANNFKIIIFTSADKESIIKLLEKSSIKTDKIAFYDKIQKPSLRELKKVIIEQGLNPKETIYIGDDVLKDLLPAKKLGLTTVIISDYVDYNINKLSELMMFK